MFSLASLFEPKPFNSGYLPVEDGHEVFFHEYGNPRGTPVLCFHGGPGSFSKPKHAKLFDLKRFRVMLFDQRGGGQSKPSGKLEHNTTADLLRDALRLLAHLKIEKTHVYGGSWGSTLALAFAEQHPDKVKQLMLSQVFLARPRDATWMTDETARFYPDLQEQMRADLPEGKTLRQYYAELVFSGDEAKVIKATQLFGSYERMIGTLSPSFSTELPAEDHKAAFRLFMHYDSHDYFLSDNQLLDNLHRLGDMPVLIIHNRLDMICPVEQAFTLFRQLKNGQIIIVPDSGHGSDLLHTMIRRAGKHFLKAD